MRHQVFVVSLPNRRRSRVRWLQGQIRANRIRFEVGLGPVGLRGRDATHRDAKTTSTTVAITTTLRCEIVYRRVYEAAGLR